jgi:PAS domain S-box-containing protein
MGKKKVISSLPDANRFFTEFFKNSQDAIIIGSMDGLIFSANPAACRMLDRTEEELCLLWKDDIIENPLTQYEERNKNVTDNYFGEFRLIKKDGTRFPVELSASVYTNINGQKGALIIARDITERKNTEKELQESEERYRNLIEQAPVGIGVYQDGKFVYVNECSLRIMGCKDQDEIIGSSVLSFVHPDSRTKVIERMSRVAAGEVVPALEEVLITKNGEVFDAEVTALPTVFNGRPAGQVLVIDITERKKAFNELTLTNKRFYNAMVAGKMAWWELDYKTGHVIANENKAVMLGYDPEKFTHYSDFTKLIHPEDYKSAIDAMRNHLEGREPRYDVEYRIKMSNGEYCWFHDIGGISKHDESGGPKTVAGFAIDISARMEAQERLQKTEARYQLLAEQSGIGIGLFSPDGKVMYYNSRALANLGGKSEDFIGKGFIETFGEEKGNNYLKRIKESIKTGVNKDYEDYLSTSSGNYCFLSNFSRLCDSSGKVIGVQILSHDITERKKMEDVIKQTNNYNRNLLEASLDPLVTISPEGIVMDVNKAAEKMIGMKRDKLIGNPYFDYVHEKNKAFEGFNTAFTKGIIKDLPLSVIHKSGKFTDVLVNATVFRNEQGQVQGILVAGRDITLRKKMESKLRYSKKMLEHLGRHMNEIRENERSQLALNLHDDLGQRLTGLFLDVAWIKSRIGVQSATVRGRLDEMSNTINETIESIREISYFLRPTILYDLGVVPAIFSQLNKFEKHTGIKCNFYFDSEEFNIDDKISLALFRIIQESLTNIMRHSKASVMSVNLKKLKKNIEMVIEDNGIGIDKDKVSSLTSMGLEGIRERAKSANGEVTISGEKGEGTRIFVTIPYKRKSI